MKPFSALVLYACMALSAWSQTITLPPQQALTLVRQFLGLTDDQVSSILRNNSEYTAFAFQQQRQIQNAQLQIAVEIAKDQIDPMAVGTLYAGIETACRELRDKATTSQKQNISILTDAQKAKLNVLNDALKLTPTIAEAQFVNLLGAGNASPPFFTGGFGFTGSIIGPPAVSGCGAPGLAVRTGNFSATLPAPGGGGFLIGAP